MLASRQELVHYKAHTRPTQVCAPGYR